MNSYPRSRNGYVKGDGDEERTLHDDRHIRDFGRQATGAEERVIAAIVKRYFDIALAGAGARACSLLSARFSVRPDPAAVPLDYSSPNSLALRGEPCPLFMSRLFRLAHPQIVFAQAKTLNIVAVRVHGSHGLVVLAFRTVPERQIAIRREHGKWKIDGLLDTAIP